MWESVLNNVVALTPPSPCCPLVVVTVTYTMVNLLCCSCVTLVMLFLCCFIIMVITERFDGPCDLSCLLGRHWFTLCRTNKAGYCLEIYNTSTNTSKCWYSYSASFVTHDVKYIMCFVMLRIFPVFLEIIHITHLILAEATRVSYGQNFPKF